jgi:hypothetical protein
MAVADLTQLLYVQHRLIEGLHMFGAFPAFFFLRYKRP